MKDLMELSSRILEKESDPAKYEKLFAEALLKELSEVKGADIAPHLSCSFDLLKWEYNVKLTLPVNSGTCIFDSVRSKVK